MYKKMKNCNTFLKIGVKDDEKISEFIEIDSTNLDIFIICMYNNLNKYFILGYYDQEMKYFPLPCIKISSILYSYLKIVTSSVELEIKDIRKYRLQKLLIPNEPSK